MLTRSHQNYSIWVMGITIKAKTDRNLEIYNLWKEKGHLTTDDRKAICKKYDIGQSRIYKIVAQVKKKFEVK